jgi:hypothetical protein
MVIPARERHHYNNRGSPATRRLYEGSAGRPLPSEIEIAAHWLEPRTDSADRRAGNLLPVTGLVIFNLLSDLLRETSRESSDGLLVGEFVEETIACGPM